MNPQREKPFELLRRKTGERYEDETVRNLYIARDYVRKLLKDLTSTYLFAHDFPKHFHVALEGTGPRMLAVARQLALSAHFINFREEGDDDRPACRTIMTIITDDPGIKEILCKEEYLCNLPKHCRFTNLDNSIDNEDSYLDIEIRLETGNPDFAEDEVGRVITSDEVNRFFDNIGDDSDDIFSIDTLKAYYTGQMYEIGATFDNLPDEDLLNTRRYALALGVYQYRKLKSDPKPLFEKDGKRLFEKEGEQFLLREQLSNIFCSDCFDIRKNAIDIKETKMDKVMAAWEERNQALSISEHARWAVEKLIMGYRPLNADERHRDELLRLDCRSEEKLKKYRNGLKRNDDILAHIDLCSYRNLRRIHPGNMKFDSFLMLAIPRILERVGIPGNKAMKG